ncbi:LIPASE/HYDROLASE FAMILY PROTEIN putative EXPRESSED-RELATED [Salix purpurea]|uniref:LIPASE/HYDROLASE FAMILY PROTEIN putative EXPRESSED-RELATED n=1 Tax=Salix purpurea TaxID=77065 RepID=A0A9Q1A7M3_SALPP|nr:LIPASE/HYDROLASE FAMILY PROTEIN putative EXPRESSED-RELATED [Salix purpurea]
MVSPSTYFSFVVFFLCSSNFAFTTAAQTTSPFKKIYAFGDSFTDTGNTRSVSGPAGFGHVSSLPYGSTFFHHPTNRYSDGRLVIDFVTETLLLPYLPPYLGHKGNASHGVNFAVAGSTAINHAFFVKNNLTMDQTPQSIQTQLIWFNKFLASQGCNGSVSSSPECKAVFDDALIWVGEIGVNDYAYIIGSSVSSDRIRELAISSKTRFLQTLLKKGVKNVVVQGLPPTGCLPLAMSLAPEDDRDELGLREECKQSNLHP